jgi:hypothetical protein
MVTRENDQPATAASPRDQNIDAGISELDRFSGQFACALGIWKIRRLEIRFAPAARISATVTLSFPLHVIFDLM